MKSDLEELIEAYEIEKAGLEKQISEYVEEGDYIYAHYHNKALRKINNTLDTLKHIQHPFYRLISEEKAKARNMNKMLAKEEYKKYFDRLGTDFFAKQIQEGQTKILEWENTPISQKYDSQEIDDALFNLAEGMVSSFKVYFKSRPDIFTRFTLKDHNIEITLLYDEDPYYDYGRVFGNGKEIKALGFTLKDEQWVYHYHFSQFKDALEIKIILARLIYDIFYYDKRYDSARIEYNA